MKRHPQKPNYVLVAFTILAVVSLAMLPYAALATAPVVTHGMGLLATVASDGAAEYGWDDTGLKVRIAIEIVNIGAGAVTIKLTPGITDTTPQTSPQPADLEAVIPAGGSITLPAYQNTFYHRAESGHATTLSLIVHT